MYIRDKNGKLVKFEWKKYNSEKQMYKKLWKILYNIELNENDKNMNDYLIQYINQ